MRRLSQGPRRLLMIVSVAPLLCAPSVAAEDAALTAFRSCLSGSASTCTLAPGSHTVEQRIDVNRSNLTIQGGGPTALRRVWCARRR